MFSLEVQCGHVVEAQTDIAAGGRVGEAGGRDLVPIVTSVAAAQCAPPAAARNP